MKPLKINSTKDQFDNLKMRKQIRRRFAVLDLQFLTKGLFYRTICISLLTIIGLLPVFSFAQKSEVTIGLSYTKKPDSTKIIVALIKSKNKDGKFTPAKNVWVNFYETNGEKQHLIESLITNHEGEADLELPKNIPMNDDHYFTITAKVEKDSLYEEAEEQVHYKDAKITLSLNPNDTARIVTAHVTGIGNDGKEIPLKGAEIKFYIKRLFGNMPATEDNSVSTDEKGEATFVYPKNIPGGATGQLALLARMEDNDVFGTVESEAKASWGAIVPVDPDPFPRAMWMPTAPIPLLMFFIIVFGSIWSIYGFMVFQLMKINNEKQKT